MVRITFVCTGNVCRSPMAYGFCKKEIEDRHLDSFSCNSCGVYPIEGDTVTENAVSAAKEYGVDISSHIAKKISRDIMDNTDLVVCMTMQQAHSVAAEYENSKIIILGKGIDDPYGGDMTVYRACAKEIKSAVTNLLDMLTMKIVNADESIADGIAEVEKDCFSTPWTKNGIIESLRNDNSHFIAAKSGGRVLGYIGVSEVAGEAYIQNIGVVKECRSFGIGELLLTLAENGAKARGCEFITLEVRHSNIIARNLYSKHGYKEVGTRKLFYHDPDEDGLIMTLYFNDEKGKKD